MINSLGVNFPDRCKFVDDLTVLKNMFQKFKSNPMGILDSVSDEAVSSDMRVNPLTSTILTTSFLRNPPSFSYFSLCSLFNIPLFMLKFDSFSPFYF